MNMNIEYLKTFYLFSGIIVGFLILISLPTIIDNFKNPKHRTRKS